MLSATEFFGYWAFAFVTLCLALLSATIFYRLIGLDLGLHRLPKELAIALLASLVQGAGFWFIASLVPGGVRRQIISGVIVAIIYWLTHLEEWSGYEIMAVLLFQVVIWHVGMFLLTGEFKVAAMVLFAALVCLGFIATIGRSL